MSRLADVMRGACALLLVACAACDRPPVVRTEREVEVSFERIEYLVNDAPTTPQRLVIDREGHARYESHTNWEALERPEIGSYETTLDRAVIARLEALLASPPIRDVPDHWGRARSGDRVRRARVTLRDGSVVEKLAGTAEAVAPALEALFSELDRVAVQVSAHPRQALRLELENVSASGAGRVSLDLVLRSIGTEAVVVRSPIDLRSGENGALAISYWPEQASAGATTAEASVHSLEPREPAPRAEPVLRIPPGEAATFRIAASLSAPEGGSVVLRASYSNYLSPCAGEAVIVGEVLSRNVTLAIPR